MLTLSEEQIKEIASELEYGMRCFYHKENGSIIIKPDETRWVGTAEQFWTEDLDDLEENFMDYLEFKTMDSSNEFEIMADFTEEVEDSKLQNRLVRALERPKPFRNFKWVIENSGEYRNRWFSFRTNRYIGWVKEQVELLNAR